MKRLLDPESPTSLDERLRSALESATSDDPSTPAIDAMSKRLGAELGIVIPPAAAPPPPAIGVKVASTLSVKIGKALVGLCVVGAAAGGGYVASRRSTSPPPVPSPAVVPPVSTSVVDEPTVASSAPTLPSPPSKPSNVVPASPSSPDDPRSEVLLVQRAQDALAQGHFGQASALANDHRRRFPNGEHTEERERIAIEAAWRSGHQDEARRRAERFFARYPQTVYRTRLEQLMGSP